MLGWHAPTLNAPNTNVLGLTVRQTQTLLGLAGAASSTTWHDTLSCQWGGLDTHLPGCRALGFFPSHIECGQTLNVHLGLTQGRIHYTHEFK